MRPMTRWLLGFLVVALPASGCQPINIETKRQIQPGTLETFTVDAPQRDQSIKVTVSSPGAPVSVYVVLQKDSQAVGDALFANKKPDPAKVLASQEKTEEASVDAKVPAKNEYAILVYNASSKSADVKVKIKGS